MIRREEWLAAAQALPVGGKRRIKHGFEATAAMDVWNNEDSWSCWCHRCHEGGRVAKQHQRVRRAVVEPDRVSPVPATVIPLEEASRWEQQRAWNLLCRKGCPPGVIPEEVLWYERSVDRLMLRSDDVALGRALDSLRTPKWLPYGAWHGKPMMWSTRTSAEETEHADSAELGSLILTEDALSAYKVAKAIDIYAPKSSLDVCATLGTSITDRFLPYCLGRPAVLCMYDGDPAGLRGYRGMRQRLAVWQQPVVDLRPEHGDPKNNDLAAIAEALQKWI